jgi:glycosyltransferase involved in cell wall biosynthesis
MKPLRLVMITRRFWPLVGGAEVVMANLAAEFRRQGARPRIVTARWERRWPRELSHRDVPVVRLPQPAVRFLGTLRYMSALRGYLREHRDQIDAVYVSMLKHDAYAALGVLRDGPIPVVLRAEGAGPTGDVHWQKTANFGTAIRRRCQTAAAVVACSGAIRDELLEAGYPADRVHYIPNGVAVPPTRTPKRRLGARKALGEVHSDLQLDAPAPLVIYTGRLHQAKGLEDLVAAWGMVSPSHPTARLWLVGEGPQREQLQEIVQARGLSPSVRLPGAFDSVEEMLDAADAFVLPSYIEGLSLSLLEAMAAGLPVIASDIPAYRAVVEDKISGLLIAPRDPAALAAALRRILEHHDLAHQLGAAARARVTAEFSLERTAQRHRELFERLIGERGPRGSDST